MTLTKQEIKDLVEEKLRGQGNQVDLGNVIPDIIDSIVDMIPTGSGNLLAWDLTSMGEIAEETDIPADLLANYRGQLVLLTKLNTTTAKCLFKSFTEDYIVFSDDVSVALWVYYNGKIKPADHD